MSAFWCDTSKRIFLAPRIDVGSENDRPLKVVSDCELLAVEVPAGYRLEGRHFAWLKLMPRVPSLHLRNWLLRAAGSGGTESRRGGRASQQHPEGAVALHAFGNLAQRRRTLDAFMNTYRSSLL
jgi:hypothetical protein